MNKVVTKLSIKEIKKISKVNKFNICDINDIHVTNYQIEDLENEEWRDIIGYDGVFSVSNLGRIKSEEREVDKGKGLYVKDAKILKQQIVRNTANKNVRFESKSLNVTLRLDRVGKTFRVATIVGQAFVGKLKESECYSKKNKIWYDCKAENLEIKTISESTKLSYEIGFSDRYKENMPEICQNKFKYTRLRDGKVFVGNSELKKEYGRQLSGCIRDSLSRGGKCKGSFWQIQPI